MAKCPPCRQKVPGWVVTFGDMMSLLLCLFVLLLSFATMNKIKFEEMAGSLKDAFGIQRITQINPLPSGEQFIAMEFNQEVILVHLVEKLQVVLSEMIDNGEAEVVEKEEGFIIRLHQDTLFAAGTVHLRREMESILMQLANLLASSPNLVNVTGHTDNQPVDQGGPYPSNWALSAARAASVVNFFSTKGGISPSRLQARGMGEFEPLDNNDTEQGRSRNRRIEVTITRVTQSMNPTAPGAPPGMGAR